jgi:hypothetical protein
LLVCVYFFLSCVHAIFVCMCVCELIQKEERFCSSRIVFRLIRYRTIGRVFCYGTVLLIIIFLDSIHFACFLLLTDYALYTHTAYFFFARFTFLLLDATGAHFATMDAQCGANNWGGRLPQDARPTVRPAAFKLRFFLPKVKKGE